MSPTNLSFPTRSLDSTTRGGMDWFCTPGFSDDQGTPAEQLRTAKQRCEDAPARLSSTPSPYSDSYTYCGIPANAMYYGGGDSVWANEVRGCLTCMDEMHVAPHDAHMFCYEEGTKKAGTFWETARGYGEAILQGARNLTPQAALQGLSNVATNAAEWALTTVSKAVSNLADFFRGSKEN